MRAVPNAPTAEVIADRYLTSPAGLRSRPFGPVDALDTHAGRAAQVRIVFLAGEWTEESVSERVAAWCGIGTAGVIGVLDFGLHDGRAFVVLPPSLGVPLERWRTMRRPSALDAATLALSFGRLVEAVCAAGFSVDLAEPCDFAVGPGPTPFLDVPLLGSVTEASDGAPGDGQAVVARIFRTTVAEPLLSPDLGDWAAAAAAAEFASVAACLDALETAAAAAHEPADGSEPVGIAGVFDAPVTAPAPPRAERRPRMQSPWVRLAIVALLAVSCLSSYHAAFTDGHGRAGAAVQPPAHAGSTRPSPKPATRPPAHRAATKKPRRTRKPAKHHRRHVHHAAHKTPSNPSASPSAGTGTSTVPSGSSSPGPSTPPAAAGGGGPSVAVGGRVIGGGSSGGGGGLPVAVG